MKKHGVFLNEADINDVYKAFEKTSQEIDPDQEPEDFGWKGWWTIYNLVPGVRFLDATLGSKLLTNWEVAYSYSPIKTVNCNGIFIDAERLYREYYAEREYAEKGKTDDDFISWIEHYLGGALPDIDWKAYIADCNMHYLDEVNKG